MKLIVTLFLVLNVLSCSSTSSNDEKVLYRSSSSTPSLEIPPDLTRFDDSYNKSLPGSAVGTRSAIGRFKESGPLLERVLPKLTGVTLQGEGDFYWLEVEQNTSIVYDSLKIFWAEEGFVLEQDEPFIGIMKTELLENKAGSLYNEDSFFNRIFNSLRDSDERDQYKTRIARGHSDNVSIVYLTQYGEEFMLIEDDTEAGITSGWQSRPSDPELEVEMLSRMMLFFGLQDDAVKQQLAKIGQFPKRARIVKNDEGITSLILIESIDRSWNRVVVQLDRLGVEIVSKNKDLSLIKIKQKADQQKKEKGFFASLFSSNDTKDEDNLIQLIISLDGTSANTTLVTLVDESGTNDDTDQANALLQYLFSNLK